MFCPQCHVDYRDGSTVCPNCNLALVVEAPYLTKDANQRLGYDSDDERMRGWRLIWIAWGFNLAEALLIPWEGLYVSLRMLGLVGGAILTVMGCAKVAKAKGYSEGLGALGCLGVIGLIILVVLPTKEPKD
jgi:hypothetical protein